MSKVYKMLSDLESTYGIAFGGSDDEDSSSDSDSSYDGTTGATASSSSSSSSNSSSSAYDSIAAMDRNVPEGAINSNGPDRTPEEARIENNPGREWNPTEDCTGAVVEAVATAVVSAGAVLTGSAIEDVVDECTTPIVPGIPSEPRQ